MPDQGRKVDRRWTGTWAAAPQWTEPADLPPPPFTWGGLSFAGSTLRQSVRVSVGGRQVRLRFSNAYGGTGLTISSVSMALPLGGQAGTPVIGAGTSAAVTFGGCPAVVIPAGAQLVSDPVDFPLTAGADVTVTIFLTVGQASDGITSHPGSRTTSYLLAGNHVDDKDLPGATPVDHWYFLTGIDVQPDGAAAAAVILGDSLTDGRGSTTNGNDRWPDRLFARLRSGRDVEGVAIVNQALGGNRVLRDGVGPHVLVRLDRDVLGVSGIGWLIVFAGVNDIGTADATIAAQRQVTAELIAAYERVIAQAHGRGIRIYGVTLTPFGGNAAYDDRQGHREAARQAVNEWIRRGQRFDAVIDFDRAVRDPRSPRLIASSLDCGDHLHLSLLGYQALADAVPFNLFR
jgi:lysophospholipase L1-like esterase